MCEPRQELSTTGQTCVQFNVTQECLGRFGSEWTDLVYMVDGLICITVIIIVKISVRRIGIKLAHISSNSHNEYSIRLVRCSPIGSGGP